MALKFACKLCNQELLLDVPEDGTIVRCPACGGIITVPHDAQFAVRLPESLEKPTKAQEDIVSLAGEEYIPPPISGPPEPTMWGVKDVLWFVILIIVGTVLLEGFLRLLAATFMWFLAPDLPAWPSSWPNPYHFHFNRVESIFTDIMTICLIYYIVVKKHRNRDFFEVLRLYKIPKRLIIKYSLISLSTVILIFGISIIVDMTPLGKEIPHNLPIDKLWKLGYPALIWFTFLAPLAAIPEEIVFRGFIYMGLKKSFGLIWAAIISSLLFVLLHAPQLGFSPFHLFIIGIGATVFMIVRIKTDSLTKSILVHLYYNFILILLGWSLVIIKGISVLTEKK
ncbi:MAG TPA: hypothetical protein DCZ43_00135 [candidate division Zixibacteria bacterium]|jgi:membrane protease YdiL (CAAX protease family)|nr:hypothetical protein [candidate division Zixibacteria bacterium]